MENERLIALKNYTYNTHLKMIVKQQGNPRTIVIPSSISGYKIERLKNHLFANKTSIKNLYSIGDGGGLTRGLMMASCSGVHLARIYNER